MGAMSLAMDGNLTLASILSMPNQWAWSFQLLMSTRTLAINLSMPSQWAQFNELSMSTGHYNSYSINAKSMGAIVLATTRTLANRQSLPNTRRQSQLIWVSTRTKNSLAGIKSEFLYPLSIFLWVRLELDINSVFTSSVPLYIYIVKHSQYGTWVWRIYIYICIHI